VQHAHGVEERTHDERTGRMTGADLIPEHLLRERVPELLGQEWGGILVE
jgi:hypothetical protein